MTLEETLRGCQQACTHEISSVFVKPCYVHQVFEFLRNKNINIGTVVGFPHGSNSTHVKIDETKRALTEGAHEVEMVVNIGEALSDNYSYLKKEIRSICGLVHMNNGAFKIMMETGYITNEQVINIVKIAEKVHVDGIVTSTGYGPDPVNHKTIRLLRDQLEESIQLKAMGGIKPANEIVGLLNLGYDRIGIHNLNQITLLK